MQDNHGASSEELLSPSATLSLTELSRSVKFSDESTLQRRLKRRDSSQDSAYPPPPPPTPANLRKEEVDSPMGPPPKVLAKTPSLPVGASPFHSGMDTRARELTRQLSESFLLSQEFHGSLASIFSQLASSDSALPEELYQLSILWVGVWAGLNQLKDHLDTIQEAWRAFETEKESLCSLLQRLEEKAATFLTTLTTARDLSVVQEEIAAQKVGQRCLS